MSRSVRLINSGSGQPLIARLSLAINPWTRLRGLFGTSPLQPDQGLWLEPCNSVHMIGMRYALDVVFVDKAGLVVRLVPHLRPWQLSPIVRGARAAIELAAGSIERLDIRLGQTLRYDTTEATQGAPHP
ncbi:MAG: DUF192 domain-containing protein [Candidatus Sericytochromatia bacterium]|nr:DUF192 domain-containing protein [Candidatus Sericytochromatia bacterium]